MSMTPINSSFRTTYINAISLAWQDNYEAFGCRDNIKPSSENPNILDTFKDFFSKDKEGNYPEDLCFNNIWPLLSIEFRYNPLEYDKNFYKRWKGENSGIIIKIPKTPKDVLSTSSENRDSLISKFLAKYYSIFPTFYGLISLASLEHKLSSAGGSLDIDSITVTDEEIRQFNSIVMQVIARYWGEDSGNGFTPFMEEIIGRLNDNTKDRIPLPEKEPLKASDDKTPVLSKWFKYVNPWNMNIMFQEDQTFDLTQNLDFLTQESKVNNIICLGFPQKPDECSNEAIMALANFGRDGSVLPFSCC